MAGLLQDKVAIVTGGASGIGRASAVLFAREGAKVVVGDISEEGGSETVRMIEEEGGSARFVPTNVMRAADLENIVRVAADTFGRLDTAFNCAGGPGSWTNAVDCTEEEYDRMVTLNAKSVWLSMKYQIIEMLKTGGGSIVNVASTAGRRAPPNMLTYTDTKHAVIGLTRSAAIDFATRNVRVNAILPGSTLTPMMEQGFKGMDKTPDEMTSTVPMRRLGRPEEQAEAALWLCSDRASFLTGVCIPVDGGHSAAIA